MIKFKDALDYLFDNNDELVEAVNDKDLVGIRKALNNSLPALTDKFDWAKGLEPHLFVQRLYVTVLLAAWNSDLLHLDTFRKIPPQFFTATQVSHVKLPDSIDELGYSAFDSSEVITIQLPKNLKVIGNHAFNQCQYLVSIKLPDGLESLGTNCFNRCYRLRKIYIPESIQHIVLRGDDGCFTGCYGLKTITFGGTSARWTELTEYEPPELPKGAVVTCLLDGVKIQY